MSALAWEARDWGLQPARLHSTAVGPEAHRIVKQEESLQPAVSEWQISMQAAIGDLREIVEETASSGWDGGEAKPLSRRATDALNDALLSLTPDVPLPDLVPEPDGGVAMQWCGGRARSLIVSFGPNGDLYFAVHLPGRSESGRRRFLNLLPSDLTDLAKEVGIGNS